MTTSNPNPLLRETQPPAANFLSVLANTAGQSAQSAVPGTGTAQRDINAGANDSGQGDQGQAASATSGQTSPQGTGVQSQPSVAAGNAAKDPQVDRPTNSATDGNAAGHAANSNKDAKAATAQSAIASSAATLIAMRPELPPTLPIAAPAEPSTSAVTPETAVNEAAVNNVPAAVSEITTETHSEGAIPAAAKNQIQPSHEVQPNAEGGNTEASAEPTPDSATSPAEAEQDALGAGVTARGFSVIADLPAVFLLPDLASLPNTVPASSAAKPVQADGVNAANMQSAAPSATPDKSHSASPVSVAQNAGTPSSPQTGAQAGGPSTQHTQTEAAQALTDSASKNTPTTAPPIATPEARTTPHATPGDERFPADAMHGELTNPAEAGETRASGGINTAQLIQTMSQTEMHVGLRSAEFGEISIRTALSQQQMIAQISVDHSDLGRAIAAATPGLQTRLGHDFGVNASIQVNQTGASSSGERGAAQQQQQRSLARPLEVEGGVPPVEAETAVLRAAPVSHDQYRLDIRA